MKNRPGIFFILFFIICWWACSSSPPESQRIKVTASIFPLADIIGHIGGDRVDVDVLIPPGASPHVFEPTPEAFRRFARTQLFVMVGAGLEFWAEKLVDATAGSHLVVIQASDGVSLIPLLRHHHQMPHEAQEGHGHEEGNPHVWLDPVAMKSLAERIAAALEDLDPGHAGEYRRRLQGYLERLDVLDEEIREVVSGFRIRQYVTFHPAWSYFSRRYGLEEVGVIQESPGRDPTPRQIETIVQDIRRYQIQAVFAEPQYSQAAANAIAQEAGVRVLLLDPLGGPNLPGRDSYIGLLEYNLEIMREAME